MDKEFLKQAVDEASFEEDDTRKLKCSDAFRLAAANDVELLDVAAICNEASIRICSCQLGCFP